MGNTDYSTFKPGVTLPTCGFKSPGWLQCESLDNFMSPRLLSCALYSVSSIRAAFGGAFVEMKVSVLHGKGPQENALPLSVLTFMDCSR